MMDSCNKCHASSNRCLTSSNKKLLGAPGIATRSKDATSNKDEPSTLWVSPLDFDEVPRMADGLLYLSVVSGPLAFGLRGEQILA